jgi:hypothetical protein
MIAANIVYIYMIPDRISGAIVNKFIMMSFNYTATDIVNAINLNYVLSVLYIVYNIFVLIKTMPPKVETEEETVDEVDEEEKLLESFIKGE